MDYRRSKRILERKGDWNSSATDLYFVSRQLASEATRIQDRVQPYITQVKRCVLLTPQIDLDKGTWRVLEVKFFADKMLKTFHIVNQYAKYMQEQKSTVSASYAIAKGFYDVILLCDHVTLDYFRACANKRASKQKCQQKSLRSSFASQSVWCALNEKQPPKIQVKARSKIVAVHHLSALTEHFVVRVLTNGAPITHIQLREMIFDFYQKIDDAKGKKPIQAYNDQASSKKIGWMNSRCTEINFEKKVKSFNLTKVDLRGALEQKKVCVCLRSSSDTFVVFKRASMYRIANFNPKLYTRLAHLGINITIGASILAYHSFEKLQLELAKLVNKKFKAQIFSLRQLLG